MIRRGRVSLPLSSLLDLPVLEAQNVAGALAWVMTFKKIKLTRTNALHIFRPIKPVTVCGN